MKITVRDADGDVAFQGEALELELEGGVVLPLSDHEAQEVQNVLNAAVDDHPVEFSDGHGKAKVRWARDRLGELRVKKIQNTFDPSR